MKPPAAMQVMAVGGHHLVVRVLMQLVVHVAEGVDMHAGGDQRDHAKHRHRERVDVVADRELERAPLAEGVPIARDVGRVAIVFYGVLGMFLGWLGWDALAVGSIAGFIFGGLWAVGLLVARRARRDSSLPFGPWMLGGAWLGILWGTPIAEGYLGLIWAQ